MGVCAVVIFTPCGFELGLELHSSEAIGQAGYCDEAGVLPKFHFIVRDFIVLYCILGEEILGLTKMYEIDDLENRTMLQGIRTEYPTVTG